MIHLDIICIGGPIDGLTLPCGEKILYLECDGRGNYCGSAIYLDPPRSGGVRYVLRDGRYFFDGYVGARSVEK